MDTTQIIIVVICSILTFLMVLLGIQVYYILQEFRKTIQKVNKMLDDGGRVTGTVGDSMVNMSGFISGIKAAISAIVSLRGKREEDHE
jgi:hypothetical protein